MREAESGTRVLKPLTFELLRRLSDGVFHSGEVLAQQLQVSRSSVNNALNDAEQLGLILYSVRGRGYRLPSPPQWLNVSEICSYLGAYSKTFQIEILDQATSSNTLLLQQATQGVPSGSVIAVEWQSNGRGRLGRTWHSGLGNALTFSLLWRFNCGLSGLSGLSLASGIAVMRAFDTLDIQGAKLKWPNDIVCEQGKIAGILIEAQGDMLGPSAVVIGIGINFSLPENVLNQIDQPVSDLARLTKSAPSRNLFLATVLVKLADVLNEFSIKGFAALRSEWEENHYYQNKAVELLLPDGKLIQGVVLGVNNDGGLLVEIETGKNKVIHTYHAGEITLRSQHDNVTV
jgi:BirA family biotin operon repressor/biotin-[acetyl-CoA-carboxylase] ligase